MIKSIKWNDCEYTVQNDVIHAVITLNMANKMDLCWLFSICAFAKNRKFILTNPIVILGCPYAKEIFDETYAAIRDCGNTILLNFKQLCLIHVIYGFMRANANITGDEFLRKALNSMADMFGGIDNAGVMDKPFYQFPVEKDEEIFKYEFWKQTHKRNKK